MRKKTFFIILIIIAGLLIIGVIIWYFLFKPSTPITQSQGPGFTVPGQTTSKVWLPISENKVVSSHFNGNAILFYDFSGQLWQLKNGDAKPSLIDQAAIVNPAAIIWSLNETNIVKTGLDQSDNHYIFTDYAKKISSDLKANIKSIAFSPDGSKIVYDISNGLNTNSLYISAPDGRNQKSLINTFKLRDTNLSWPKNNLISLTAKPSGLVAGSVWTLNTTTLGFSKLIDGLSGLETLWAPDGNSFIYSYTDQNGQNPKLAIYKNGVLKNIDNIATLVDKCVWSKDSINIYCAVPESWPDSIVLPDDYYKNIFLTTDDLWKINTETGEKNLIFQGIGNISNLNINSDNNSLIFISKSNGFLYQLNLK